MSEPTDNPDESRRRAIFAMLVEVQDKGMTVTASRAAVARRFEVAVADVARIEREGIDAEWPPL